jgi:hypothetical protein
LKKEDYRYNCIDDKHRLRVIQRFFYDFVEYHLIGSLPVNAAGQIPLNRFIVSTFVRPHAARSHPYRAST